MTDAPADRRAAAEHSLRNAAMVCAIAAESDGFSPHERRILAVAQRGIEAVLSREFAEDPQMLVTPERHAQ